MKPSSKNQPELGRQNAELRARLEEAEETLRAIRALAEFTHDWEYWRGPDGRFRYVSPSCERITGYRREEFLQDPGLYSRIIHPDDRARVVAHLGEDLLHREACELEFRILRRDGQIRWIGHVCQSVIDESGPGRPLGRRASNRDITERKQLEQALRDANDLLEVRVQERTVELRRVMELVQAEQKRFNDVLDLIPAYVVLLSPDYRVPFANRFFEERFGKSEGRLCFEYLFQRTAPCENCESYTPLRTGAPHHWDWTGPDGRDYDIHDFPFTDVDGSLLIMEVGLDVTEQKKADAELARYREHLEELVRHRSGELAAANTRLQAEVAERTRAAEELEATNAELQRFNRAMVDRELRMIELKREVNELSIRAGQPPPYPLDFEKERL